MYRVNKRANNLINVTENVNTEEEEDEADARDLESNVITNNIKGWIDGVDGLLTKIFHIRWIRRKVKF